MKKTRTGRVILVVVLAITLFTFGIYWIVDNPINKANVEWEKQIATQQNP